MRGLISLRSVIVHTCGCRESVLVLSGRISAAVKARAAEDLVEHENNSVGGQASTK